jgi:hypothetical protein
LLLINQQRYLTLTVMSYLFSVPVDSTKIVGTSSAYHARLGNASAAFDGYKLGSGIWHADGTIADKWLQVHFGISITGAARTDGRPASSTRPARTALNSTAYLLCLFRPSSLWTRITVKFSSHIVLIPDMGLIL